MAYKALYRTYRPSTFDEVAGQQHILKTLKNALVTGKIAHAYLFAGPRGTGKTTMAKLLAKALNCDEGMGHQCNNCPNCKGIMDGTHPDVLELDAASNNGVDQIREIIDGVKYGTSLGKYKIYIIDEVHMLSAGAFNALLKTLEEPPAHVIFILATTEPHKILPTILSRCQRYDFTKVSEEDINNRIKIILEKENVKYNEEAINLIIKLADGGMRDALSLLDQVLAYSGSTLNEQDVLDIFALESKEEKLGLLNSIIKKDVNNVLTRLNKYIKKGSDLKRLTDDLLVILKDSLIFSTSRNSDFLEVLNDDEVRDIVRNINEQKIMAMINVLMDANKDYKNVTSIAPIFEITLLRLVSLSEENTAINPSPVVEKKVCQAPVVESAREEVKTTFTPTVQEQKVEVKEEVKPTPVVEKPDAVVTPVVQENTQKPAEKPNIFETPSVQVSQKLLEIKGARNGDFFSINDDTLIKLIVKSKKEIKNNLLATWPNLKTYTASPKLSRAATLLIDGRPLVAGDNFMIVTFQLSNLADKANRVELQKELQDVAETVFHKKMFIYGINRSVSVDLQNNYIHMSQAGNLPKLDTINIEFIGE